MKLGWKDIRKACKPQDIRENHQIGIPIDMVGQERVKEALNYALSPPTKLHIRIISENIKGETVKKYLENKIAGRKQAGEKFSLSDLCYIYNFTDPSAPALLKLPAGSGKIFKAAIERIKDKLAAEIPAVFHREEFKKAEDGILNKIRKVTDKKVNAFWKKLADDGLARKCRKAGLSLMEINDGLSYSYEKIAVKKDGKPFADGEFQNLPASEQAEYKTNWEKISKEIAIIENFYLHLQLEINETRDELMEVLKNAIYETVVKTIFSVASRPYGEQQKIKNFINGLENYAMENKELFLPAPKRQIVAMTPQGPMPIEISPEQMRADQLTIDDPENKSKFVPFKVNLLVDNTGLKEPPIIVDNAPTYPGLFGKIERKLFFGGALINEKTDHTMLRVGSFHKAQGGFLIIDLNDVLYPILKTPILLGLKRVLQENKLETRDIDEEIGSDREGKTIRPESLPLELKVILLIHPLHQDYLWQDIFGKKLMENFPVKAEFDCEVKMTPDNYQDYCAWIRKYAKEKNFIPFAKTAQAKIIEYLLRENEHQERLAWRIEKLKTIVKESYYCAAEEKASLVEEKHVKKALEEKIYRSNLYEERRQRAIKDGRIVINVSGEKVGEINGLGVYDLDDYSFGAPSRITVTTHKGEKGLINIERAANVSDSTHTMGVDTLIGFFYEKYGRNKILGFEGMVRHEQAYCVSGPSASMAELMALISSISGKPIKQGIAITGTVDQHGGYGIIGGVNQKIEGFYDACKLRGLTGEQGLIIPEKNTENLMLKEEVVKAVKDGKFHIYAEKNVDGVTKILMGEPKEVDIALQKQLNKWSKKKKAN